MEQEGSRNSPTCLVSGDTDIIRAPQLQHAVERVDSHIHLRRPALIRMRATGGTMQSYGADTAGLGSGLTERGWAGGEAEVITRISYHGSISLHGGIAHRAAQFMPRRTIVLISGRSNSCALCPSEQ